MGSDLITLAKVLFAKIGNISFQISVCSGRRKWFDRENKPPKINLCCQASPSNKSWQPTQNGTIKHSRHVNAKRESENPNIIFVWLGNC